MRTSNSARLALLVLSMVAAPALAGEDCKFAAERSAALDTTGAKSIEIVARAGELELRPSSTKTIAAEGRACASSEEYLAQVNVRAQRKGDVVRVYVEVPEQMSGLGVFYAWLDLTVDLPTGLPVTVTDSSGDMSIDAVQVVRITDSSGDIVARKLPADVEIGDSSGEIRVENAAGRVTITDSSGDIVVRGAREVLIPTDSSGSIRIEQVSGNVRIENDSSGDVSIADVGGSFELLADSSGDVDVSEVKGAVSLPQPD